MIQSPVAKGKMCISKLVDKWFLEVVASQWVAKRLYQKKRKKMPYDRFGQWQIAAVTLSLHGRS